MAQHRPHRYTPTTREELDPDRLPPLLRMGEVTAFLDCHERTVREHVASGRLPAYRLGREFRFKRDDVLALLVPVPVSTAGPVAD